MCILNEILTLEHESEHVLEHDLSNKKQFSAPKIYTANGDLSKRWYVYFSFRNPQTGKLERMKNIYGKANLYKTKENRIAVLTTYRRSLLKLLKQGYDPFADNTALYKARKQKATQTPIKPVEVKQPIIETKEENSTTSQAMGISEAFNYALTLKENMVSSRTLSDYRNKCDNFLKWLKNHHPETQKVDQLNKKIILEFLNSILTRTSARYRNNYRVDLSSIIQTLEDNDIMASNIIKKIPVLRSIPERNKTYTTDTQERIFNFLEEKDPILLLYIKFISYNFLRPVEVCRLKVKDINLETNTIEFKAKNSNLKTKIIPELLLEELPDLSLMDGEAFLFTPEAIGAHWDATETNRRDHFTKRFKKVVKEHFDLNKDYGLYSFRHTYITKLYRFLVKNGSPFEARSKLMLITGHTSMIALQKYLRDIDAELPEDYSEMLR